MTEIGIPKRFSVKEELGWKRHVVGLVSDEGMTKLYQAEHEVDGAIREVKAAQPKVTKGEQDGDNASNKADGAKNEANGAQAQKGTTPTSEEAVSMGTDAETSSANAETSNQQSSDVNTTFNGQAEDISAKIDENSTKMADWQSDFEHFGQEQNDNLAAAQEILANAGNDAEDAFKATYTLKTGAEQQQAQQAAEKNGGGTPEQIAPDTPDSTGHSSEYQAKLQAANDAKNSAQELGAQIDSVKSDNDSLQAQFDEAFNSANTEYAELNTNSESERKTLDDLDTALTHAAEAGGTLADTGDEVADIGTNVQEIGGTIAFVGDGLGATSTLLGATGATLGAIGAPLVAAFGLGAPVVAAGTTTGLSGVTVGEVCMAVGRTGNAVSLAGAGVNETGVGIHNTGVNLKRDAELSNASVKAAKGDWDGANQLMNQYEQDGNAYRDSNFTPLIANAKGAVDSTVAVFEGVVNVGIDIAQGDYEAAFNDAWKVQADAFNAASSAASLVSECADLAGDNKTGAIADTVDAAANTGYYFNKMVEGAGHGNKKEFAAAQKGLMQTGLDGVVAFAEKKLGFNSNGGIGSDILHNKTKNEINDASQSNTKYTYNGKPDPKPKFSATNAGNYQQELEQWYMRHPEARTASS